MRKGKQKVRLSSSVTEIDGNNVAVVRKTKRSTAGRSKPKILEKDPLALPKSPRSKEKKAAKTKTKAKVKAVPTKAARKQQVEEEYEVEQIVAHRPVGCDMSYRIRWKGWGPKDDTWQLEHELNCDAILQKYKESIRSGAKVSATASSSPKKKAGGRGRPSLKGSPKKKGVASGRVTKKGRGRPPKDGSPTKKKKKRAGRPKKEWEVEEVVAVRKTEKGKEEFLIKWKGYDAEENTWEPAKNVANCKKAIIKFKQLHGDDAVMMDTNGETADDDDEEEEKEGDGGAGGAGDKDAGDEDKMETSGKDDEEEGEEATED